uniref:Uncharacterized protein n=2 Tax=Guillardia theta TaxID=55529 RepID=A0A6U5VVG7_GUITH
MIISSLPRSATDASVYTGGAGIAYALIRVAASSACMGGAISMDEKSLLGHAQTAMKTCGGGDKRAAPSLLCGVAGNMLVHALIEERAGRARESEHLAAEYLKILDEALRNDSDEWLYGRAGYLQGLLTLRKLSSRQQDFDAAIRQVSARMVESGRQYASRCGTRCPLMYQWYGEEYLGAAHGLIGIVHQLLMAREVLKDQMNLEGWEEVLVKSLDYIIACRFDSGNYPAVRGDGEDYLLHFCHGAPGAVFMFLAAFRAFPSHERYLHAARQAGDCVWEYGLLKKGPGLCHGVAGNGYCFLALYRDDPDTEKKGEWLHRAVEFAEFMREEGERNERWLLKPDNPYSLFEGLGGAVCFLADLVGVLQSQIETSSDLDHHVPSFPLFETPLS